MRYCFVLPHFDETLNSFSKMLEPLLDALLRESNEICILSGNQAYAGRFKEHHRLVPGPRIRPAFLEYIRFVLATSFWLKKNRQRFDIIHNVGVGSTLVQDVMTAHACHRAWIQVKWDLGEYPSLFLNPVHALAWFVESINYLRRTPVIAVSESLAQQILRYYPGSRAMLTVVPNGLPDFIPNAQTIGKTARRTCFRIITASNDHRKKGLGPLIEALRIAKKQGKDWQLVVLGKDSRQARWEQDVKSKKLEDSILFLGHVTNIQEHFAEADVFCMPSFYESFGLVYLEAAQVGLPIIGTTVGIYPDLVRMDFPPLPLPIPVEVNRLLEALTRVESDQEWRERLGSICQLRALAYSQNSMIEGTRDVYENISLPPRP